MDKLDRLKSSTPKNSPKGSPKLKKVTGVDETQRLVNSLDQLKSEVHKEKERKKQSSEPK